MDVDGAFGEVAGKLDYSMFIVTVRAGAQRAGCLARLFGSFLLDPISAQATSEPNFTFDQAKSIEPGHPA